MKRSPRFSRAAQALVGAVILMGAGLVLAQGSPVAQNSSAVLNPPGTTSVSMLLVPNGTGTSFANCFDSNGNIVNVWISVALRDAAGGPAILVPAADVRLEEMNSPLAWCPSGMYPPPFHAPNLADMQSDLAGQTGFGLSYHGGGWVQAPTYVWVLEATGAWNRIPTPLQVSYNSPDLNGDLFVNLLDVSAFAVDYFSGVYAYRSDFNNDGILNLADISLLAPHMGKTCP